MSSSDDETEVIQELVNQSPLKRSNMCSVYSGRIIPVGVIGENDLAAYCIGRLQAAEVGLAQWPPLMRLVIDKAYRDERTLNESTMALIEVLLNVPLQVRLVFGQSRVDLNDPNLFIPFRSDLFYEAAGYVRSLLRDKTLVISDIRLSARCLFG